MNQFKALTKTFQIQAHILIIIYLFQILYSNIFNL